LSSKDVKIRIQKTTVLPVVLYGCETWSLTLREVVFENRVLRRIFGPRRDEVTGGWRKLHDEELRDLYSSPSIDEMGGPCSTNGKEEEYIHVTGRKVGRILGMVVLQRKARVNSGIGQSQ
jgi:hypothetical protein